MAKKTYTNSGFDFREFFEDVSLFIAWSIFGVLLGWFVAYVAHGIWLVSPYSDYYGIAGALLAALWVNFRRNRHLEHLPHVRKHLEKMAK